MRSKVHKLDVDKLVLAPADLNNLSNVVKRRDVYNAKIKNIKDKIPGITNLILLLMLNKRG